MAHNHELTEEELFCLQGCRSYKQYHKMRKGFEEGVCAFCNPDRKLNKIIWEDENVYLWHVPTEYMRKELASHWLIVPVKHVRFETDLTPREWISVFRAKRFMHENFDYRGGVTHVREGDMRLNAGTVPHLHYNIFMPNKTGEVRIPVFKTPEDSETNLKRVKGFEEYYNTGIAPHSE